MSTEPDSPDFDRWSPQELQRAERAAMAFLDENIRDIADTLDRRIALLRRLTGLMRSSEATFDDRMLYLSMVEEIAISVGDSARDFFDLGSGPRVARLVR